MYRWRMRILSRSVGQTAQNEQHIISSHPEAARVNAPDLIAGISQRVYASFLIWITQYMDFAIAL